jgi:hypothetical protein
MPHTITIAGLHEFVARYILADDARPTVRAVDLGSGWMAARLREHLVSPPGGHQPTRKPLAWIFLVAAMVLHGESLPGDNRRMLVLKAQP